MEIILGAAGLPGLVLSPLLSSPLLCLYCEAKTGPGWCLCQLCPLSLLGGAAAAISVSVSARREINSPLCGGRGGGAGGISWGSKG